MKTRQYICLMLIFLTGAIFSLSGWWTISLVCAQEDAAVEDTEAGEQDSGETFDDVFGDPDSEGDGDDLDSEREPFQPPPVEPSSQPSVPWRSRVSGSDKGQISSKSPSQTASRMSPGPDVDKTKVPVIEFQNAPVYAVLDYYAKLTKRSIISAPNLSGVINFRSQTDLEWDEAIQALDSILAINGIGTVPMGEKFLKVVQIASAKQEGLTVGIGEPDSLPPADTLVTQIVPLKFTEAAEVVSVLQPYMHTYGQLIPLPKSGSILVTDTGANITQMLQIIKYVDQPSQLRMQTKVYVLKEARAADVVQQLQSIVTEAEQLGAQAAAAPEPTRTRSRRSRRTPEPTPQPGATGEQASIVEGKVIFTSDERTNKIFLLSRPTNFDFFEQLIEELDARVEPDVIMKVIPLDYANAEDAASLLNSLITGGPGAQTTRPQNQAGQQAGRVPPPPPTPSIGGGQEISGFLQFAEGIRILPDPRANSLLVVATRSDMESIQSMIDNIDTPVAQVLIEVVIAEVILGNDLEIGVDTVKRIFDTEGGLATAATGSGAIKSPPVDLSSLSGELFTGLSTNATQIALAAASGGLSYFTTFEKLKLDLIVRMLATSSKVKILSTPVIQTLHNQEASIIVGEERPFPTDTVSDVVAANTTVRSSVEFRDIAIELVVTPRINPDGYVTMDIEQKINSVGEDVNIGGGVIVSSITKREARSAVSVKDQSTIMLGGMIQEDKRSSESKVPFLGDIPVVGNLFKTRNADKNRTELIVFIRPTVLRTDEEASAEVLRRANNLKVTEELDLDRLYFKGNLKKSSDSLRNEDRKNNSDPSIKH